MKLYYAKGACSLAIRITLNEIGTTFKSESVNLKTKQTEAAKNYLEINPKGAVPALELDNHEVLTENAVIHQYLADTFKASHLLPPIGSLNRYRVLEWLNFISTDLHKTCSPLFNSNLPGAARDMFTNLLLSKLKLTNKHLHKKEFLMGDEFTVADSYLFVVLSWMPNLDIDLSQFSDLSRYYNQLQQRPSIQKSLKEELSA